MARCWNSATQLAATTTTAVAVLLLLLATPASGASPGDPFSHFAEQIKSLRRIDEPTEVLVGASRRQRVSVEQELAGPECEQKFNEEHALLQAACNTTLAFSDRAALSDLNNNSPESQAAADRVCAPPCQAGWRTMASRLSTCYNSTTVLGNVFERLDSTFGVCAEYNGMSCARNVKQALSPCDPIRNEAECTAPNTYGTPNCWWGRRNASGIGCHQLYTDAVHSGLCACIDSIITANTYRLRLQLTYRGTVNDIHRTWELAKANMCARVGNTFCYPRVFTPSLYQLYGADFSTIPVDSIAARQRDVCDGVAGECVGKVVQSLRALALNVALVNYRTRCTPLCAVGAGGQTCPEVCAQDYLATAKTGYVVRFDALCGRNTAAASTPTTPCMQHWHEMHRDSCNASIVGGTCNADCAASFATRAAAAGCCTPVIERAWRNEVPREVLPSAVAALLPAARSQSYANSQVRAKVNVCSAADAAWGTANAGPIAATWTACSKAASPRRILQLPSLRWSAVQDNDVLRARLVEVLKLDVGTASGTASEDIDGAVAADGEGGILLNFTLSAETAASAARMMRVYDAAVSSGSFAALSTAALVADECSACVSGDPDAVRGSTLVAASSGASVAAVMSCGLLAAMLTLLV